jgi:hypothetical protein
LIARFDKGQPKGEPWPALTLPRISTPLSSSRKIPVTAVERQLDQSASL